EHHAWGRLRFDDRFCLRRRRGRFLRGLRKHDWNLHGTCPRSPFGLAVIEVAEQPFPELFFRTARIETVCLAEVHENGFLGLPDFCADEGRLRDRWVGLVVAGSEMGGVGEAAGSTFVSMNTPSGG